MIWCESEREKTARSPPAQARRRRAAGKVQPHVSLNLFAAAEGTGRRDVSLDLADCKTFEVHRARKPALVIRQRESPYLQQRA